MGHQMTKTSDIKTLIEQNRRTISEMLHTTDQNSRLNNLHWIRDELSKETRILFQYPDYMPQNQKSLYLDFNNIKNMGSAWDYIVEHDNVKTLDTYNIRHIHTILSEHTDIPGGVYRISDAHIMQMGVHAPSFQKMLYHMDDIVYQMQLKDTPVLLRAFNVHYDLIATQPFNDFNKRTARLVMNWFLISHGYRPILFNMRSDKEEYMAALRARANGDAKAYYQYMYSCMLRTQRQIIKRLRTYKRI